MAVRSSHKFGLLSSLTLLSFRWVQSGFFTLHSLTMLMKIHSYCSMNGYYSSQQIQYNKVLSKLKKLVSSEPSLGGWDNAVNLATAKREEGLRAQEKANQILYSSSPESLASTPSASRIPSGDIQSLSKILANSQASATTNGNGTSPPLHDHQSPLATQASANVLRQRLHSLHALQTDASVTQHSMNASAPLTSTIDDPYDPRRHILCHHSSSEVSALAQELTDIDIELTAPGGYGNKEPVRWPKNISLWNFMDYQLIPTLVYEMQYPRTAT